MEGVVVRICWGISHPERVGPRGHARLVVFRQRGGRIVGDRKLGSSFV